MAHALNTDQALNRLSLVAHSLRYLAEHLDYAGIGSLLAVLADDLEGCLQALDKPNK